MGKRLRKENPLTKEEKIDSTGKKDRVAIEEKRTNFTHDTPSELPEGAQPNRRDERKTPTMQKGGRRRPSLSEGEKETLGPWSAIAGLKATEDRWEREGKKRGAELVLKRLRFYCRRLERKKVFYRASWRRKGPRPATKESMRRGWTRKKMSCADLKKIRSVLKQAFKKKVAACGGKKGGVF